ncbi:helix-turn-helix transcriptional regulator [Pedobacter sp.]|uniref:AraC family transcriptional regulator n=1 Tax=Pedobacter sp. TaxID=1411316 RepID=UPI002D1FBBC9|nr:helix-turn-helix transcriptional regulator [Pedobacter sp.]
MKEVVKPTKLHRHSDYHEMIFLSEGSGSHEIDDTVFDVVAPVVYYLRPGQAHCWNFTSIPKGFVILIKEDLLLREDIDLLFDMPVQFSLKGCEPLLKLVEDIQNEFVNMNIPSNVWQAYFHLLLVKLKHTRGTARGLPQAQMGTVQKYKRLIDTHFKDQKNLGFYASLLSKSTASLNEVCKKAVNKTASALISERVILEAKLLLSATGLSVSEISNQLGFSDAPHFAKIFKLRTNLTPGTYRDMSQKK